MGKDRHSTELETAHNNGQTDAANGNRDHEPYGLVGGFVAALFGKDPAEMREENDAYEEGRDHHDGQSRVICTHFYKKGMLLQEVWRADMKFTATHISKVTVRGYHYWAIPYVKLMRRNQLAERLMFPLAKWRAEELAYQMGVLSRGNFKGKIVRLIAEPLCWLVGYFVDQKDWRVLGAHA